MRPKIVVLVGLPGSGKSTWVKRNALPAISSDEARRLLTGSEDDQTKNRLVFRTLRDLVRLRLRANAPVTYIDATALSLWERRCWIRMAQLNDCGVEAVFFDTPIEECQRRNATRARVVPQDVIERMAARLVVPTCAEGFDAVTTIR